MIAFVITENFWKIEKKRMKFSPTVDLGTFLANLHMCTFSTQMSEFYSLVVLEWKHDDFLRFENFSKK